VDPSRQRMHLRPARLAIVDQHQRLQAMHPGITLAIALPACLLDQPACGQLYLTVSLRIGDHAGVLRTDARHAFGRNYRVLEEASGITQLGRVWQLFAANAADRIADRLRRRFGHALLCQALADRAVVQVRVQGTAQGKPHPQDQRLGYA